MLGYAVRRLLSSVAVFVASTFVIFGGLTLIRDERMRTAIRRSCSGTCDRAAVDEIGASAGLGRSIASRYVDWFTNMLSGDLGRSRRFGVPVADAVWPAVRDTMAYVVPGMILLVLGSLALSLWSARHWHSKREHAASIGGLFLFAAPPFLLPLVLQLFWGVWLPDWTGVKPFQITGIDIVSWRQAPALFFMPIISIVIAGIATETRLGRFAMREFIDADFIRTARAKGLSERQILYRHVLPMGIATAAPSWGIAFSGLLGYTLFIETIFGIRGIGSLTIDAIAALEVEFVVATTGFMAFAVTLVNLIADLVTAWIDPRVRMGTD